MLSFCDGVPVSSTPIKSRIEPQLLSPSSSSSPSTTPYHSSSFTYNAQIKKRPTRKPPPIPDKKIKRERRNSSNSSKSNTQNNHPFQEESSSYQTQNSQDFSQNSKNLQNPWLPQPFVDKKGDTYKIAQIDYSLPSLSSDDENSDNVFDEIDDEDDDSIDLDKTITSDNQNINYFEALKKSNSSIFNSARKYSTVIRSKITSSKTENKITNKTISFIRSSIKTVKNGVNELKHLNSENNQTRSHDFRKSHKRRNSLPSLIQTKIKSSISKGGRKFSQPVIKCDGLETHGLNSPFEESLERHRSSLRAQLNLILPRNLSDDEEKQLKNLTHTKQPNLHRYPKFISKSLPNLNNSKRYSWNSNFIRSFSESILSTDFLWKHEHHKNFLFFSRESTCLIQSIIFLFHFKP